MIFTCPRRQCGATHIRFTTDEITAMRVRKGVFGWWCTACGWDVEWSPTGERVSKPVKHKAVKV